MFGGSLLEHVTWTKSLANSSNVLKDHVLVRLMPAKLREADADLRSNILAGAFVDFGPKICFLEI